MHHFIKRKITYIILILFSVSFGTKLYAQNTIDSLSSKLALTKGNKEKSEIYLKLSKAYAKKDLKKALYTAYDGMEYAKKSKNILIIRNYYTLLGTLYVQIGVYEKALKSFYKAKELSKQANDKRGMIASSNNIGTVYDRTFQYDKALTHYLSIENEYLKDTTTTLFNEALPSLYNNIGNIYDMKSEEEKAFKYYFKSLYFSKKFKDKTMGKVLRNLGDLYIEQQNYEKAEQYLSQALEYRRKGNDNQEICTSLQTSALLYVNTNQLNKALTYLEESLQLVEKTNSISLKQQIYFMFSIVYEEKKDIRKAFDYFKLYKDYSDSLFNEKVSGEITKLEIEYHIKAREEELKEVQEKRENRLFLLIATLLITIIIVSLLYFLLKSRMIQEKLQKQNLFLEKKTLENNLEIKNKELITNVMYLVKKNELIKETTEKLLNTIPNLKQENKKALHDVILNLQSSTSNEVWQDFEVRFNEVHSEFYEKLRTQFKELTPNEIRLCAFLKLNMTTKEISAITQQSARSIEVARVRLRKKLQITNTSINLVAFLNEL